MSRSAEASRNSAGEMLFGHIALFLFCVFLPAIMTAAAPLTVTHFGREGSRISAQVSKRTLFLIPFSRTVIDDVRSIGDRLVAGTTSRSYSSGKSQITKSEDAAFITIEGATASAKVEVSPVNIRSVRARVDSFLADETQTRMRLVTIANWKFGALIGGVLSFLTLFYVYLQLGSLVRWAKRLVSGRDPEPG